MIDPVSTQVVPQNIMGHLGGVQDSPATTALRLRKAAAAELGEAAPDAKAGGGFGAMISDLVHQIDEKGKVAATEAKQLMLGESDNLHRSMIAMQESGLAFTMLVEVRNKLVESYQELMRMPV